MPRNTALKRKREDAGFVDTSTVNNNDEESCEITHSKVPKLCSSLVSIFNLFSSTYTSRGCSPVSFITWSRQNKRLSIK